MKNIQNAENALTAHVQFNKTENFAAEDISALITNLAHYAESMDYNLQEIIRIAALNYEAERNQSPETGGESSDSQAT